MSSDTNPQPTLTDDDRAALDDADAVLLHQYHRPKHHRPPCDYCPEAALYFARLGPAPDPDTPGIHGRYACDDCRERLLAAVEKPVETVEPWIWQPPEPGDTWEGR